MNQIRMQCLSHARLTGCVAKIELPDAKHEGCLYREI